MSVRLPQEILALLGAVTAGLLAVAAAWLGLLLVDRLARRTLDHDLLPLNRLLLHRLRRLVLALAFLAGAELSLERLAPLAAGSLAADAADEGLYLGRVLVLYLVVVRSLQHLASWYEVRIAPRTESTLDEQILPFLRRILLVLVTIAFLVSLLQHYGQEVGVVLASLGVASLAVALAARSTLEDVIAGIILMVDRPFRIGDRVELAGLDLVGDVADIGLRSTRIHTRDNRLIVVPNARIANDLLVNLSFPDPTLRLEFDVGVHYDSSIEKVREVMLAAMAGCEGVRGDPEPEALFLAFGDSALHMRGRYWISSYADWRRMQDRVHTAILSAFREAGIEIPYPQRTLTLGAQERRLLHGAPSTAGQPAPAGSDASRESPS